MPNPVGFYKSISGNQFGLLGQGADAAFPFNTVEAAADGLTVVGKNVKIADDGIIAHPGGGQALATLLTATFNTVATVASPADSVRLPVARPGAFLYVYNAGANSMQVWGSGGDTIDAGSLGVSQGANTAAQFFCSIAGAWHSSLRNSTPAGNQQIFLSDQPGIDPTGLTDSRAGVITAMASVAATNKRLVVDCPVYIATGFDPTKTIYVQGGTNLTFTSTGAFIFDALGVPAISWIGVGASNCTWENYTFRYIGNPGASMLQYTGTWSINNGAWNTTYLTNYMIANNGNTFSGATALWPGPTNTAAIHYIGGGVTNLNFIGHCSATAVYSTADRFAPVLFSLNLQYVFGLAVTGATPVNSTTCAQPTNISFDGWTLDGYYMGFVGGGANIHIRNIVSLRYGDLEDSSGNNQGGIGTVSGRSGNLATDLWFAPPHLSYLQSTVAGGLVCSVDYLNILDEGIYTTNNPNYGSRRASGYCNSIKLDASGLTTVVNYTSKRPDGFADILSQNVGTIAAGCFMDNINVALDCGIGATYVPVSAAGVGATSFTINPTNWMCNQSGGSYVGVTSGTYPTVFSTGELRMVTYTVTVVGNSATAVTGAWTQPLLNTNTLTVRIAMGAGSAGRFAFRYPGLPCQNVQFKGIKVFDSSLLPWMWPIQSDSSVNHVDMFFDCQVTVQDFPTVATYFPGFGLSGEGVSIKSKYIFNNCSSTQTLRGPILNNSANPTFDHTHDVELHGWRQTAITFAVAPTGTSANLLSTCWPLGVTGWIYTSGVYNVLFSDNEVRAVTFNQGSVACTWAGALTGTPTVNAVANLVSALTSTAIFDSYKPRIELQNPTGGIDMGVHGSVRDYSNGLFIEVNQGLQEEQWTQYWQGSVPAGATYTPPMINFPAAGGWAVDRTTWGVVTNFGTIASVNVGQNGGSATAFLTGANVTTATNTPRAIIGPVASTGAPLLTPNVNFDGTGVGVLSQRGVRTKYADGAS